MNHNNNHNENGNFFQNINWGDPFGFNSATPFANGGKNERPTIISDDDLDYPLYVDIEDEQKGKVGVECIPFSDAIFGTGSSSNENVHVHGAINGLPKALPGLGTLKHIRQRSVSAPTTPPSRSNKFVLRVNKKAPPLLLGVVHCPAPSKKNRVDIVMKNIENIVKFNYDGVFFINHGYSAHHLVSVIKEVHQKIRLYG